MPENGLELFQETEFFSKVPDFCKKNPWKILVNYLLIFHKHSGMFAFNESVD